MQRREATVAIAGYLVSLVGRVHAQVPQRGAARRVAIVDDAHPATRAELWASFRARLGELGYVEDRTVKVDERFAGGDAGRLEALASEVVATTPDVIVNRDRRR